jgi:ethanolaminephosphotransferase
MLFIQTKPSDRPNTISFIGFIANLVPHVLMAVLYGADMEGDMPGWFLTFTGIAYFIYQLCDNMDGKQARRTGSSSPLGMLFDHGIDCFTSLLNNLIF